VSASFDYELRRLLFLLGTVSCDWCDGIKRVGG